MGRNEELRTIKQYVPISSVIGDDVREKYGIKGLAVRGVAVTNQSNLLGIRWTEQALQNYAEKLKTKHMVLNHSHNDVTKVIGKVVFSWYNDGKVEYYGDINDKHPSGISTAIERGDVKATSVSAYVKDFRCSICGKQIDECNHRINQTYNGVKCEGLVYEADAIHLGVVTEGADPSATVGVAQSISASDIASFNEENIRVLVQSINERKKVIVEQSKGLKEMSNEEKETLKELVEFKQTVSKLLEQMKNENEQLKEENARFRDMMKKIEQEKKDTLISQICEITGEDPKEYQSKSLNSLEDIYNTVKVLKQSKKEEDTRKVEQVFHAVQPQKKEVDKREEAIRFIGRVLNLSWAYKEDDPQRNEVCRVITQSVFSGTEE